MRKSLLIGSIILAFSLYVWRTGAAPAPAGLDAPLLVPDRRVLPLAQGAPARSDAPTPAAGTAPGPAASTVPAPSKPAPAPRGQYRDGEYRGDAADAYYGYVQVSAVVRGGRLSDVQILQYPNDRGHSIVINDYALPNLVSEAVHAQSADVQIVSGATDSSMAFRESLATALAKARA